MTVNLLKTQFEAAMANHRAGEAEAAEVLYRAVILQNERYYPAWTNLGVLYLQKPGNDPVNLQKGIRLIEHSLGMEPRQVSALSNLGNGYKTLGQLNLALAFYDKALQLDPTFLVAYGNKADCLRRLGRHAEGVLVYKEALVYAPASPETWSNLGGSYLALGDFEAGLSAFDKAIALKPGYADAWYNRGNALRFLGRADEAVVAYRRAIKLRPGHPEAWMNLGVTYQDQGRLQEALGCYNEAEKERGAWAALAYNRGQALELSGRANDALADYYTVAQMNPRYPNLWGRVAWLELGLCRWADFETSRRRVLQAVEQGEQAVLPFQMLSLSDEPLLQLKAAQVYGGALETTAAQSPLAWAATTGRKIRLGYFSPDLRTHAVGFLTAGLFEQHDREAFEVHAFVWGGAQPEDPYQARIFKACKAVHDLSRLTDAQAAALAREVGIDIAVDLSGYTKGSRPGIFAQRAAPCQVNYLGYPGTMGVPWMDYILADRALIPEGLKGAYTERVVYLDGCFQVNDDQRQIETAGSRAEWGLPDEALVLASFNSTHKINPEVIRAWAQIMAQAPGSVLWLLAEQEERQEGLIRRFAELGIGPDRLIFAGMAPYARHLARYHHVDLVLDTFPFSGGTSTSDALWGGAPVLTLRGKSYAGRMSASLLAAAGLSELITEDENAYVQKAQSLLQNPALLTSLKARVGRAALMGGLFSTKAAVKQIEDAYRKIVLEEG